MSLANSAKLSQLNGNETLRYQWNKKLKFD